jgi:hypothetical protein
MKRMAVVLLILVCVSSALSAQMFSAGFGGTFNANFATYDLTSDAKDFGAKAEDWNGHFVGGGVYGFFDATYIEANVGLLLGNANQDKLSDNASDDKKKGSDVVALTLGLFGKYPIAMGGGVAVFPMLGVGGQIPLGGKTSGKDINDDEVPSKERDNFKQGFNQFWFKAGLGFDVPISGAMFFRPEFLYGIRLNTEDEKDTLNDSKIGSTKMLNGIVGHGLDVRLALGFKF